LFAKKETRMNRAILVCALLLATAAVLGAQQASQSNPYQGVSNPPPDDTIVTETAPAHKPSPAKPVPAQAAAQAQAQMEPQPTSVDPAQNFPAPNAYNGADNGIVQVAPNAAPVPDQPGLDQRSYMNDPDGDIVHPAPLPPGELGEGTNIRVELLGSLSTADNQSGDTFRTRVATDVLQDGQVLIPAGSEIDGTVVRVSSGHFGGHGSMHLRPEMVTLPGGARFRLYAQLTGTPDSRTRVGGEGTITPGSRLKRDGIEYGGAVGGGAVAGAFMGGPAGALAGSLVGASLITVHLLVSHPQANLEPGTTLMFSLTQPLNLVPTNPTGN
jgi:hypothetical protein